MCRWTLGIWTASAILLSGTMALSAPEKDPLKPRVPADQMADAKKLSSSLFKDAVNAPADVVREGNALYDGKGTCFNCHGKTGKGDGAAGVMLDPKPRDFTTGIFKFRSTPGRDSLPTDVDLYSTITHGLWGTSMPAWQEISDHERRAVIQHIKTFSPRWTKEAVAPPITIVAEPPITIAALEKGQTLFVANCMLCHGQAGKGDGPMVPVIKDAWGEPLKPANFTLAAGLPGGVKLSHDGEHLFRTVTTGVGGTPMPVFGGQLKPEEIWDIVHYVQSLRVASHEAELVMAGLKDEDREQARSRIWAGISLAARRGELDQDVLRASSMALRVAQDGRRDP